MREESNWVEIISAFAIGVGVGAALGVLFAPKAGDELRGETLRQCERRSEPSCVEGSRVGGPGPRGGDGHHR